MIEFIDGEDWCRWNGLLMSPEEYLRQFGIDGEPSISDDLIEYDGVYYTDMEFGDLVMRLASWFGTIHDKVEEWDEIANEGRGFLQHSFAKSLENCLVIPKNVIEGFVVKPYNEFKKDYPKFDQEKWEGFMDELDDYYNKMLHKSDEK